MASRIGGVRRGPAALGLIVAIMMARLAGAEVVTCPEDICECLGEAGHFNLVANSVSIQSGKMSVSGYGYALPSTTDSSVCAVTGKLSGKAGGETEIGEDLILTASTGIAATFKGYKSYGYAYPGVLIDGELDTGGGSVKGLQEFGVVAGTTDTIGASPEIAPCQQALTDMVSASSTLGALAPTQPPIDKLIVSSEPAQLTAGAGVNVIQIGDLVLKPHSVSGYAYGAVLTIGLEAGTTSSVIINVTHKLSIGKASQVIVDGGDIEDVIINVVGQGPSVKIKSDAAIDPPILAPARKMVAGIATTSNLFIGSPKIKGTAIAESLICP